MLLTVGFIDIIIQGDHCLSQTCYVLSVSSHNFISEAFTKDVLMVNLAVSLFFREKDTEIPLSIYVLILVNFSVQ